jgi:hypothetical protein
MNKANTRELKIAIAWLDDDTDLREVRQILACRTLAAIQRCGTPADQRAILAIIKDRKLSHHFYTENHCLVAY